MSADVIQGGHVIRSLQVKMVHCVCTGEEIEDHLYVIKQGSSAAVKNLQPATTARLTSCCCYSEHVQ